MSVILQLIFLGINKYYLFPAYEPIVRAVELCFSEAVDEILKKMPNLLLTVCNSGK